MSIFDKLVQKEKPIDRKTDTVSPEEARQKAAQFLMKQNRAFRRGFKKQNGIMLAGLNKPLILQKSIV